uniref:Structural maintenance of chromosomes protein 6 n=1 Tax=Elaeophora elaphi TaxID=1147741 RepID=A0A0R3RLM2_9BILA
MPRKKRGTKRISNTESGAILSIAPQFQPIKPSRQNISELLSIIGAHANVKRVNKDNMMKKGEVYGWLGAGAIQSVFKYCNEIVLKDDFIQLNKYPHGEISMAIINIISKLPDILQTSAMRAHKEAYDVENLFVEAAFAQNFIFTKEGTSQDIVSEQSVLYSGEPTNMFCFVPRADSSLLCDEDFEHSAGRLFGILPDRKLRIAAELAELQREYTAKFGNYEADKSLSNADWDEISALNASISEAESFELVVDEENKKQDVSCSSTVNLSAVLSEERFVLLQEIKNKEKELRTEQEKFKYSLIPQENIAEARARFRETLMNDAEYATASTTKKKLLTVLGDSRKGNT